MPETTHLALTSPSVGEHARRLARETAKSIGFSAADAEAVALSVSELASNVLRYARSGTLTITSATPPDRVGIVVECHDLGPGIDDIDLALRDGYSTGGGLGGGLGGVRRLMDEFEIASTAAGTHIVARKWLTRRSS